MNESEAIARIKKAISRRSPKVEVYKQDAEVEGSVIKIERQGRKIEIAIANATEENNMTSQFF